MNSPTHEPQATPSTGMPFSHHFKNPLMSPRTCRCLILLFLALFALPAPATVSLPTGEYRASAVDLRVKVQGGEVVIQRTWQADDLNKGEYRWHPNPAWDDLRFELDVIDGVPKTILRSGSRFERGGNEVYIWQREYFIRAEKDEAGDTIGWRWYDRRGNWITYDAAGKIASYGDRNGVTVQFERDAAGKIARLRDANDAPILTYAWNGDRIASITDRTGRVVSYHYSGNHLTRVTDVLGHDWTYTYAGGLLTSLTDPEDRTTSIAYSGNRAVRVTDALDQQTNYSYDYDRVKREYTVVIRTPENRRTERRYNADGRVLKEEAGDRVTRQLIKDGDYVDIVIDERGGRTRTEYDANRNPVKVIHPDGGQTRSKYDGTYGNLLEHTDERGIQSKYEYNAKGRLTKRIEAVGLPEQRITEYTYDARGQRVSQTVKGQSSEQDATTTWEYDAYGNVTKVTNAEGHETSYTYHVTGMVLTRTDARNNTWTAEVNAAGQVTATSDPLGHGSSIEYDKVGNRIAVTDALGHTTTYEYDALNRLIKTTDPLGHSTTSTYSPDGRHLTETNEAGATTTYGYDPDGRLISITDPAGNAIQMEYGTAANGLAGLLTATTYPTYREEYRYDPRGRRTQTIQVLPANGSTPEVRLIYSTGYDGVGNSTASTDAAGRATLYEYDALNRLIKATDANAGVTLYGYDTRDNLASVTDANGNTHVFTHDKTDQVKTEARPSGATIHYAYDATGNLTQRTSPNGERRQFDYDAVGRKTEERQYPKDAIVPSQTIVYSYDARNALIGYLQSGDTHSAATYSYDAKGQKTEETVTYGEGQGAFSLTTKTSYTATGQKQSFTYPDDTQIQYTYTSSGLLNTASLPGKDTAHIHWQTYQWQQPTKVTMPGAVRTLTYDALQRPIHIASRAIGGGTHEAPTGDTIMDYRYTYDAAGNITQRETEDGAYQYGYDLIDRLTSATPPTELQQNPASPEAGKLPVEAYSYDPVHNRLSSQHQPGPWQYNADNQLLGYGIGAERRTYTYNPNGHAATEVTGDPSMKAREFIYNAAERLIEIRDNNQAIGQYQHDPMGRRIKKQTNEGTTWFLYADEGLIAELDQTGNPTRYYGWKPGGLWSTDPQWLADKAGGAWQTNLYHNDHLWTPQRLTDNEGGIQWSGRAEAFGKTAATTNLIDNPLRFPGQYFDEEAGTHNNYHREYAPEIGLYRAVDAIGIRGGINVFSYVDGMPSTAIDPLGLSKVTGTWIDPPRINITGVRITDMERISPYWSWWGYIKFVRVYIEGSAFVNIDVRCVMEDFGECGYEVTKEWEMHLKINRTQHGHIDLGPNVYASIIGLRFGWKGALFANYLIMSAVALQAEYQMLQKMNEELGPVMKQLMENGPTAMCLMHGGAQ